MKECDTLLNRALDSGINYVDTADCYGDSEEKIGRIIESLPRGNPPLPP
jgi:aryl-alcohol dehydrogenase-like predicted oxidoreductase